MEGVSRLVVTLVSLASRRPRLGTLSFVTGSKREHPGAGRKGCVFIVDPTFVRTYGMAPTPPPRRALLAPAVQISPIRIARSAGVDHESARFAIASMIDAVGRRVCSGATLRLPFGSVGTLVAKEGKLDFAFGEAFSYPKLQPKEDEFGGHVRRILSTLDASRPGRVSTSPAQSKKERGPQESSTHRARTASGEVSSWRNRRSQGSGAKAGQLAGWTTPVSSEAHGRASLSVGVINPRERSEVHTRSRSTSPRATPETTSMTGRRDQGGASSPAVVDDNAELSPKAAKRILPHFLAICNPGSQALEPTQGADIVQQQALERFRAKLEAHAALNHKEDEDILRRQVQTWEAYERRQGDERRRLRDNFEAIKTQAEARRVEKERQHAREFLADHPDPSRAYPCRMEYDAGKEEQWRRAWCADLRKQVSSKRRREQEQKRAEASCDRLRASQLEAAIRADRRRELLEQNRDRERIQRVWKTQVAASANAGRRKGNQMILLDKIVR